MTRPEPALRPATSGDLFRIWGLALGYFAFYTPYSALTKALSTGRMPGADGPVPGFLLLPATAVATSAALLALVAVLRVRGRSVSGQESPSLRLATVGSGLATAVIIATTTLNYTFAGISILLALLLMRGGVLILAPVVDALAGRRVGVGSWVALGLSAAAVVVAFSEVDGYRMTLAAGLSIGAYLAGYVVRLNLMTRLAKSDHGAQNFRYFLEETFVAAVALTVIPALIAVLGRGEAAGQLRDGFTHFFATGAVWPALAIGLFYACLYVFGTAIYLDRRENTYCVPLNRCASMMSGLLASYGLAWVAGWRPPSTPQLVAAGLVLLAIGSLLGSTLGTYRRTRQVALRRLFLFVCGGNASRSPMAQAICNDEIARRLGLAPEFLADGAGPVRALSAGLTAEPGRPFAPEAVAALEGLGVRPHAHRTRAVTADLVDEAEVIFCMTEGQQRDLVGRFPGAAGKVHRLDPDGDIDDPKGQGPEAYRALGERLRRLVPMGMPSLDPGGAA